MSVWDVSFGSVFVSNSEKNHLYKLYYFIHIKKDLVTTKTENQLINFSLSKVVTNSSFERTLDNGLTQV